MYLTRPSRSLTAPALLFIAAAAAFGCSKTDKSASSATHDSASTSAAVAAPSTGPTDITPVRGTVASVTDSVLTVSTPSGDVRVSIATPLDIYASMPATLSKVQESSFVGVTSVAQSDGSQRATEIHIFPEKLRGTGEGSYPMTQQGASAGGGHNTMTNGTVSASRMTNGTAAAPRMTNGTIGKESGGTLTVQYQGGTQTITVPSDVHVTEIAVSQTKLAPGAKVVVLAKKQADGTFKASAAIMAGTEKGR
jgi:hypothetical protein